MRQQENLKKVDSLKKEKVKHSVAHHHVEVPKDKMVEYKYGSRRGKSKKESIVAENFEFKSVDSFRSAAKIGENNKYVKSNKNIDLQRREFPKLRDAHMSKPLCPDVLRTSNPPQKMDKKNTLSLKKDRKSNESCQVTQHGSNKDSLRSDKKCIGDGHIKDTQHAPATRNVANEARIPSDGFNCHQDDVYHVTDEPVANSTRSKVKPLINNDSSQNDFQGTNPFIPTTGGSQSKKVEKKIPHQRVKELSGETSPFIRTTGGSQSKKVEKKIPHRVKELSGGTSPFIQTTGGSQSKKVEKKIPHQRVKELSGGTSPFIQTTESQSKKVEKKIPHQRVKGLSGETNSSKLLEKTKQTKVNYGPYDLISENCSTAGKSERSSDISWISGQKKWQKKPLKSFQRIPCYRKFIQDKENRKHVGEKSYCEGTAKKVLTDATRQSEKKKKFGNGCSPPTSSRVRSIEEHDKRIRDNSFNEKKIPSINYSASDFRRRSSPIIMKDLGCEHEPLAPVENNADGDLDDKFEALIKETPLSQHDQDLRITHDISKVGADKSEKSKKQEECYSPVQRVRDSSVCCKNKNRTNFSNDNLQSNHKTGNEPIMMEYLDAESRFSTQNKANDRNSSIRPYPVENIESISKHVQNKYESDANQSKNKKRKLSHRVSATDDHADRAVILADETVNSMRMSNHECTMGEPRKASYESEHEADEQMFTMYCSSPSNGPTSLTEKFGNSKSTLISEELKKQTKEYYNFMLQYNKETVETFERIFKMYHKNLKNARKSMTMNALVQDCNRISCRIKKATKQSTFEEKRNSINIIQKGFEKLQKRQENLFCDSLDNAIAFEKFGLKQLNLLKQSYMNQLKKLSQFIQMDLEVYCSSAIESQVSYRVKNYFDQR